MKKLISLFGTKVRVKAVSITLAVTLFFIVIVASFSYPILFRTFTRNSYTDLCATADAIDLLVPDSGTYYFDLYALAQNRNTDFEIVSPDGFLLYTSKGSGSATSSSHFATSGSNTPEYDDMAESVKYKNKYNFHNFEIKKKLATNADYFVYHEEISTGDTVYIYYPVANIENIVAVADRVYYVFAITMIILIGMLFYIFISHITKPVEQMNSVTGKMAALDFSKKCGDYGKDEFGELGRSINKLSDKLDLTLDDLKDKNEQLEKDIQLRLALDNARKSFISNVSHELKTPIAIISGYAEGLCEGISDDPQAIKEYCGIINEESRKMNELVLELLELSKLESKSTPFTPDYYDLGESIASIVDHLSLQLETNGITLENNVPLSLECYAQGDKIEIVLKNYITNAISHCSGDKKIIINSRKNGRMERITVFNTGDHISKEDLPEIWESFFRADKAHERSSNRFGLGLSIVKGIMSNHNCDYGVSNVEGGVEFYFEVSGDSDYYENENG